MNRGRQNTQFLQVEHMTMLAAPAACRQGIVVDDQLPNRANADAHRALAAAASTLPGSDRLTVTSREPHFGQRMRLDSMKSGTPFRVSTASSGHQAQVARHRSEPISTRRGAGLAQRTYSRAPACHTSPRFPISMRTN